MQTEWNWGVFLQPAPYGDTTYLGWLWLGFQMTLLLSFTAGLFAFIVGSFFGILRTLTNRILRGIAILYVEIFRNIPLIIHLFVWVYVIPEFFPESFKHWLFSLDPAVFIFVMAMIGLGFFTGARICEQVRTAIQSLPAGQKNAGLALGFTRRQTYQYILLPNAYRRMLPPFTSELLNMVKNSAVASTVGVVELSKQANQLLEHAGTPYESFIAVTAGYILINSVLIKIMKIVEKRARPLSASGGR